MDWAEKENRYCDRWVAGRVPTDIWKYIPGEKRISVADVFADSDGYWIYLEEGYTAYDGGEDCRTLHEFRVADLKDAIKTIRKVK